MSSFSKALIASFVLIILGTLIWGKASDKHANLIYVEGGTFIMGLHSGSEAEMPAHEVQVSSFYIGKYEVTQKEWKKIMGKNPSFSKSNKKPVEQISWLDAIEYCNRRSEKEGLEPCYMFCNEQVVNWDVNANGYRLPTEAEWEFAARGGLESRNTIYSGSNQIYDVAWYVGNNQALLNLSKGRMPSTTPTFPDDHTGLQPPIYVDGKKIDRSDILLSTSQTATYNVLSPSPLRLMVQELGDALPQVGTKIPNELGIYDMSGCAVEWCWDAYHPYSADAQVNPHCDIGTIRIMRGGSFLMDAEACTVTSRYTAECDKNDSSGMGFRVVRSATVNKFK